MNESHSVTAWIDQLKLGDQEAATQIWERYFEQLVTVARSKLEGAPTRAVDEEDVALLAFDSLFRGVKEKRFPNLDDRDDLWQLLLMLTERKAIDQKRRESSASWH